MTQQYHLYAYTLKKPKLQKTHVLPVFIAGLFTIAKTRKQPRCPLTNEWIKKLWYIHTMECYSGLKRNAFESVLMIGQVQFSTVQSVSNVQLFEPQHARPPCPSLTPGVHTNSVPSSRWCHSAFSSSVMPFSPSPQSFPASGSFQMSQLFALGGQSTGDSDSTSALPMNTQDLSPLWWTG